MQTGCFSDRGIGMYMRNLPLGYGRGLGLVSYHQLLNFQASNS
jgi:hypothetical protein